MENRPFTAQNTDIFKEALYSSEPATFGTDNVIVTQALNRTLCDQNSTCIAANPQRSIAPCCQCPCGTPQIQSIQSHKEWLPGIQSQKEYIPGGVCFTFNPLSQNYALRGFSRINHHPTPQQFYEINRYKPCCLVQPPQAQQPFEQPLTLEQQIALKQLEREGLELLLLQEHLKKNPYKIQFHYNGQTSTTDLLNTTQIPPSHGMPDFKNINEAMRDIQRDIEDIGRTDKLPSNDPPTTLYSPISKAKKLILTKSPDIQTTSEPSSNTEEKQVSEENPNPQREQTNVTLLSQQTQRTTTDQAVQTKDVPKKKKSSKSKKSKKSKSDESLSSSSTSENS